MATADIATSVLMAVGRFGLVGAICAILNVLIVYLGTEAIGAPYGLALLATCLITIPLSYLLHRTFTFQRSGPAQLNEFARFSASQIGQFLLGALLTAALVEGLGWRPWRALMAVTAALMIYGFIANSLWVFRWRPTRSKRPEPLESTREGLRVLQVSAFFASHGGGIEVVAHQLAWRLAPTLAAEGGRLVWMAGGSPTEMPTEPWPTGLRCERAVGFDPLERRIGLPAPVWSWQSAWRLRNWVRKSDVVHVHDWLYMPSLLALLFARGSGTRLLLTQHIGEVQFRSRALRCLLNGLNRSIGAWAMARADQVVFVGGPVQAYFEQFARFRRPPHLLPNGVDHRVFHPNGRKAPGGEIARILFVGRFVEKKGINLLRNCIDLPSTRWTFVGWGPQSPACWSEASDQFELPGRLAPSQVADHCRQADLLVLPSTGEGFPLVLQEALACGTPVLISSEVAAAFPVKDSRCIFDVELRVPEPALALRQALATLVADRQRLLGHKATEAAVDLAKMWSWDGCAARYRELYRVLEHP